MNKQLLCDSFSLPSGARWEVSEAADEDRAQVDGYSLLARARGPAFLVEAPSLNHRYYTRKLWDRALSESAEVVTRGKMLGTIGHEQAIDDKALLEGKVSHRVAKLWIDETSRVPGHPDARLGFVEVLVLNTPAGRVLNGYLRGGVELPVSSRAFGDYLPEKRGEDQVVDPENFVLETFDFVKNAGVTGAVPRLVESQPDPKPSRPAGGGEERRPNMPDDVIPREQRSLVESVTQEKMAVQRHLDEALKDNENQALQLKLKDNELSEAKKTLAAQTERVALLEKQVTDLTAQDKDYVQLGEVATLKTSLTESYQLARDLTALGGLESLKERAALLEQYRQVATVEEMTEMVDLLKTYAKLGTPKEIGEVLTLLKKYVPLGTPEEIGEAFKRTMTWAGNTKDSRNEADAKALAEQYGVDVTAVLPLVEAHGKVGAERIVSGIKTGGSVESRYRIQPDRRTNEGRPDRTKVAVRRSLREDVRPGGGGTGTEASVFTKPRLARMFEAQGAGATPAGQ